MEVNDVIGHGEVVQFGLGVSHDKNAVEPGEDGGL